MHIKHSVVIITSFCTSWEIVNSYIYSDVYKQSTIIKHKPLLWTSSLWLVSVANALWQMCVIMFLKFSTQQIPYDFFLLSLILLFFLITFAPQEHSGLLCYYKWTASHYTSNNEVNKCKTCLWGSEEKLHFTNASECFANVIV